MILYKRLLPSGPAVRIRRTSEDGELPVRAVLEVDRRAGTPREKEGGTPPPLIEVEGASDEEVVSALQETAADDRAIAQLMRDRGIR
jgi:hypothetical protein